jgi:hypothetical protein
VAAGDPDFSIGQGKASGVGHGVRHQRGRKDSTQRRKGAKNKERQREISLSELSIQR